MFYDILFGSFPSLNHQFEVNLQQLHYCFLQELYRSSRSERRPEGPKCLGKNDCSFRSNGPARPAAAGPQRPPVTSRPLFDDQTQSRHKFKSCTIIVQLYLLYTHSASKACTFLCSAPFSLWRIHSSSYHEQVTPGLQVVPT